MLGATTQGPISTIVLMMELTGRDRSFVVPLLLVVATATLVARTIEPRSIYAMQGAARWEWQHAVSATKMLRYSITFRTRRQ